MTEFFDTVARSLAEMSTLTIFVRVLLAMIAGGIVGLEREFHGRAAGMRTHMLVCLGSALAAIIGVCMAEKMLAMGGASDIQRTGAQVMSGVGFLGAGTILLKKGNSRITGLTTAAGLWATAAIGLAIGFGIYAGAFFGVLLIVLTFTLISKLEFALGRNRQRIFVYLELRCVDAVKTMTCTMREQYGAMEIQVTPPRSGTVGHVGMEALIRIPPKVTIDRKIEKLQQIPDVIFALPIH